MGSVEQDGQTHDVLPQDKTVARRILGGFAIAGSLAVAGGVFVTGVVMAGWNLVNTFITSLGGPQPTSEALGIDGAPGWTQDYLEIVFASQNPFEAALKTVGGAVAVLAAAEAWEATRDHM